MFIIFEVLPWNMSAGTEGNHDNIRIVSVPADNKAGTLL
jgi:hypothetical protein